MKFDVKLNDGQELKMVYLSTERDSFDKYKLESYDDFAKRGQNYNALYFCGKHIYGMITRSSIFQLYEVSIEQEMKIKINEVLEQHTLIGTHNTLYINALIKEKDKIIKILSKTE